MLPFPTSGCLQIRFAEYQTNGHDFGLVMILSHVPAVVVSWYPRDDSGLKGPQFSGPVVQ